MENNKKKILFIIVGVSVVLLAGFLLWPKSNNVQQQQLPVVEQPPVEELVVKEEPKEKPVEAPPKPPAPKPVAKPASIIAGVWNGTFTEAHICQDEYGPWTASITEDNGKVSGSLSYGKGKQGVFLGTIEGTNFNLFAGSPSNPAFTLIGSIIGSTMAGTFKDYDPCEGSEPIVGAFSGTKAIR